MSNDTLQQVALSYSKTQQMLINSFMKELKFLKTVPFMQATHGLFNQYEEVSGVSGASFREWDAPNAEMDIETIMKQERLGVLAGEMSVSEEKALMIANNTTDGGKAAEIYFAKRTPTVLNDAGKATERHFIYEHLYKKAYQYNKLVGSDAIKRTIINAGGTGSTNYSIMAIRQNKEENCGLLSPIGENKDEVMVMDWLCGGERHKITSGSNSGKIGYEATWKAYLGYQVARPDSLGMIVNIDPANSHDVTAAMIDDLLDRIEADPSDTILVMNRGMKTHLGQFKYEKLRTVYADDKIKNVVQEWNDIPLIGTNTMLRGTESAFSMPF